ncbi:TniQ family protein [Puniceibacterium sp. IMCC21224]|uniref:TniQ family protein n=1 Tax=Puniceibacterium sp. IMCC21224 TaxID=1618204 RepID=UPI00064DAA48|nr:TniQ family protein [Puniceibacterium sp. IMCC21224]KMK68180.1 TniQ protein [Puniceibacterium sp. IMCC21224]
MTDIAPLPLKTEPVPRETALSYMSRLAAANGVNARDFGIELGVSFQRVMDGEQDTIKILALLGGADHECLERWSGTKLEGRRHELCGEIFPAKTIRKPEIRGCPICLRQDAFGSKRPPEHSMAIRGHCLVPDVTICLSHEHPLVPLWRETQPFARYDTVAQFRSIAPAIVAGDFDREIRELTDFDEWLEARLVDGPGNGWLDMHPLHAASTFCFLLGSARMRHETTAPSDVDPEDRWALLQMGYEVARHGPKSITTALQRLQDLPGDPHQGPKAIYPVLYDRLSRDYADVPAYAPFRAILRDHLLETWPLNAGDDLLGEPVERRRLHSVRSAARETGIDPRRMRKMLESAGILNDDRPDAWAVFDAAAAAPLLDSLTTLLPAKSFAEGLGMSRSQFDRLAEDGVLAPKLTDATTKNIWDPREGQAFIDSLLAGAEPLRQAQHRWAHISKSAARLKIRPGDIVRAIQAGRIRRVGNHSDFDGYKAVYVYHDEVSATFSDDGPPAMSLELFAKTVGIGQPAFLNRLVSNGHTTATTIQNPRTRAMQRYFTEADSVQFHEKFYTFRTMAKAHRRSWQNMSGALAAAGIEPFSPDEIDYGKVFLRAEVDSAVG